jgi:hypothetical protein
MALAETSTPFWQTKPPLRLRQNLGWAILQDGGGLQGVKVFLEGDGETPPTRCSGPLP